MSNVNHTTRKQPLSCNLQSLDWFEPLDPPDNNFAYYPHRDAIFSSSTNVYGAQEQLQDHFSHEHTHQSEHSNMFSTPAAPQPPIPSAFSSFSQPFPVRLDAPALSMTHYNCYEESQSQSQFLPFGTNHTIANDTLGYVSPSSCSSQPSQLYPAQNQPTHYLGVSLNDNGTLMHPNEAEIVTAAMGDQLFAANSWRSPIPSGTSTLTSSLIHEQGYCSFQMPEARRGAESSFHTQFDSSISETKKQEDLQTILAAPHLDLAVPTSAFVSIIALPSDRSCLTAYQLLLRHSLEYFSASQNDTESRVRGRKQKIRSGQIGVRCRDCAHLQVQHRGRGAVYYPKSLINVYQAAQNIAGAHLCSDSYTCLFVLLDIAAEIKIQKPRRDSSKAGRTYWVDACKKFGIVKEDGGLWLRMAITIGDRSIPGSVPNI